MNEIEDLKRFLCPKCKNLKGNAANITDNICCGCYGAAKMRELGKELLVLVDDRYQVQLLKEIRRRGYITILEIMHLNLNYEVSHKEIAKAMGFNESGYGFARKRLGFFGRPKLSREQIERLVDKHKHVRIDHFYIQESQRLKKQGGVRHGFKKTKSEAKTLV